MIKATDEHKIFYTSFHDFNNPHMLEKQLSNTRVRFAAEIIALLERLNGNYGTGDITEIHFTQWADLDHLIATGGFIVTRKQYGSDTRTWSVFSHGTWRNKYRYALKFLGKYRIINR